MNIVFPKALEDIKNSQGIAQIYLNKGEVMATKLNKVKARNELAELKQALDIIQKKYNKAKAVVDEFYIRNM